MSQLADGLFNAVGAQIVTVGYLLALWPVRRLQAALRLPALRVYLSSTVADLTAHRDAVARGARRAGCTVIDPSEATGARRSARAAAVQSADLFVGLYAWKYGPLLPGVKRSWTEEELGWAEHVPRRLWLLPAPTPWPGDAVHRDERAESTRIEALRTKVAALGAAELPSRPGALEWEVYRALTTRQRELHPDARWWEDLVSFRTFAISGVVAVLGALYADLQLPGSHPEHLVPVLAVATAAATATYLARLAATRLVWTD
jgi:hypothetical protein